ncbi:hypothetical protein AA313_de0207478 [Arthrobotrys entomopaga]|nr:hypothetical protein AA313_de0207478 [Arthrobotrys entomopaga]
MLTENRNSNIRRKNTTYQCNACGVCCQLNCAINSVASMLHTYPSRVESLANRRPRDPKFRNFETSLVSPSWPGLASASNFSGSAYRGGSSLRFPNPISITERRGRSLQVFCYSD